ncbi:hypothetical protein GOBAR_DD34237 [Gossypium barbadense]|nr:hypothetical protein GOBAR_DD34237 [Gossypium barbadense]
MGFLFLFWVSTPGFPATRGRGKGFNEVRLVGARYGEYFNPFRGKPTHVTFPRIGERSDSSRAFIGVSRDLATRSWSTRNPYIIWYQILGVLGVLG